MLLPGGGGVSLLAGVLTAAFSMLLWQRTLARFAPEHQSAHYNCVSACDRILSMATTIQIRNVPEELHRALKIRAVQKGMTLSDYLLAEIEQMATKPTLSELMDRLAKEEPVELDEPPAAIIRRHRDAQ